MGEKGPRHPVTGETIAGPETLTDAELAAARVPFGEQIRSHPLDDEFHRARSANWGQITVPFLTAANWGGQGLHTRGNFEGFTQAAAPRKWLEVHGLEHWTHFYTDYGVDLQKRFFACFLHGDDSGWRDQPPVQLQVRQAGRVHAAGRAGVAAGPYRLAAALPAAGLERAQRGGGGRPGEPVLPRGLRWGHVHRGPG